VVLWTTLAVWSSRDHYGRFPRRKNLLCDLAQTYSKMVHSWGVEMGGRGTRGNASTCQGNGEKEARPAKGPRMVDDREHGSMKGGEDAGLK